MVDSYLRDVGYLTSDLMTGKSLPVLAAIALLPLDASLLGTMVCLVVWCPCSHVHLKQVEQVLAGVFGGSCVTLWYAWNRASPGPLTWGMRFLNLSFGAYLNVAFALHVVCLAGEGTAWLLPAFCVVMQVIWCPGVPGQPDSSFTGGARATDNAGGAREPHLLPVLRECVRDG